MATKTITLPDVGAATDVVVIEVLVKAGDEIAVDQTLLTLESDKATMDVPATAAGKVESVNVKPGDKIGTGATILTLAAGDEVKTEKADKTAMDKKTETLPKTAENSQDTPPAQSPEKRVPQSNSSSVDDEDDNDDSNVDSGQPADVHAGPAVRRIAREFGVDLTAINASGPKNRILKEDIQAYVKSRLQNGGTASGSGMGLPTAPDVDFTKFGTIEKQPLSRIKKLTGKFLHRNWLLVPHVTQFGEADMTDMDKFRSGHKANLNKNAVKLTPLVFIMKAVAACLKAYPQFNASLDSQGENLILKKYFHIGVAVDTPEGLVVPVIRDVDQKGLYDLAHELYELSAKARKQQLSPQDMQGGCFSISSLGGIGGTAFTPIVNVPEVAILGVSKAAMKPIYQDGQFVPRLMLPLSLSYDHRVIDGADGARFMVSLTESLADIRNLLL